MTRDQQKRINAMCGDLAKQVKWPVKTESGEWEETYLHRDDWRHMWAGIQLGSRFALNPEEPGKFITLAVSSLKLTDEEASEVIDRMTAFGNSKNVEWSDPEHQAALRSYAEWEI